MAFKPPKATKAGGFKVSQEIDLNDALDFDFTGLDELKQVIGEAALERIRERTADGTSITFGADGNARLGRFPGYSSDYKDSREFKAFGKTPSQINLELTGDMLALMDFKIKGNKLILGWDDPTQNAKAFNHQTGDTVPRRSFFGVSKGDLADLKSQFKDDLEEAKRIREEEGRSRFNEFALELIDRIKDDDGDGES